MRLHIDCFSWLTWETATCTSQYEGPFNIRHDFIAQGTVETAALVWTVSVAFGELALIA